MPYYAGIGARQTPVNILEEMTRLANILKYDYTLRSGGARGADTAFERGVGTEKDIWLANSTRLTPAHFEIAEHYHPAWNRCSSYVRRLHARNTGILLGEDLLTPVEFVICWTPNGDIVGGTGQALRVAYDNQIPVYNLASVTADSIIDALRKQSA